MILVIFLRIYKNKEVAKCLHGYCNYAPHSDITRYQNLCPIPSSSRICIQISLTYPALPNWHFQILPLYYIYAFRYTYNLNIEYWNGKKPTMLRNAYLNNVSFYLHFSSRNKYDIWPGPGLIPSQDGWFSANAAMKDRGVAVYCRIVCTSQEGCRVDAIDGASTGSKYGHSTPTGVE